ncbi:MFS transporter [Umezawaea sp.]|uniref:MFS transporter n=1 Tax=Umezawaea sp. TaxID=1955258 RepID=UPI002ED164DB
MGLLRNRDFRLLWAADVVSQVGTGVTVLAVPLLAVRVLDATSFEVAMLRFGQTIAFLLIGLQVGVWCDRLRCRPLLVAADLGRALALLSVPVAAAAGVLTLAQLFVVVLVTGTLTVVFDIAHPSYVPRLVDRAHLVEANTKLQLNRSTAAIVAPSLGGGLVQWLGAPVALLVDACTYLWSALWLRGIRAVEPVPDAERRRMWPEVREGLGVVFGHPVLRAISCHGATFSVFQSAHSAVVVVFLVRDVHLSPVVIGLLGSVGLLGAVSAALLTGRLAAWIGEARLLWIGGVACGVAFPLFPLTSPGWGLVCYVVATCVTSFGIICVSVLVVSYRQAVCPPHLLGRVNATSTVVIWGAIPVGSLFGGAAATLLGVRGALVVAAAGVLLSSLWLVLSPLRGMRDLAPPGVPVAGG